MVVPWAATQLDCEDFRVASPVRRLSPAPFPNIPWLCLPQSVDKRCRRSHGRVERLAMDGPLVSRYLVERDHPILYEAIHASLRSHHDRFAEAAQAFCGDRGFVEGFRSLGRSVS